MSAATTEPTHAGVARPEAPRPLATPARVALGLSLLALLGHALHYAFLTDDAYISFRYARNWAEGAGLVFNPGYDRVEGYTNFLWVALLAGFQRLGVPPESAALPLSFACTAALWLTITRAAMATAPRRNRTIAILLPPWLLAITASVAVWASSGLETRLFELLTVAGVLCLLLEDARLARGEPATRPLAALLLASASLTRPDGLLISGCAFGAITLLRWHVLGQRRSWLLRSAVLYTVLVGAHLLFRRLYYHAWLPNTYYAKVDGNFHWQLGWSYLEAFALEHAVYWWLPLLIAGVYSHLKRGDAAIPLVFGAVCIPHAAYVASIGGDHFEYRPLDLYFGFAFLLMGRGAALLVRGRRSAIAMAAYLLCLAALSIEGPYRAHSEYPDEFQHGFPANFGDPEAAAYLDPDRGALSRLPILRSLAMRHRDLLRELASHFSALRREEHQLFLESVVPEGLALRALVAQGTLPADTHVATCCVGAIPYYSRLRTLDRIGLTDATVAHGKLTQPDLVAHAKSAPRSYGRESGVDLWSVDPVHLLFDSRDPDFRRWLIRLRRLGSPAYYAELADAQFLVAELPQGIDAARRRFPRLAWHGVRDEPARAGPDDAPLTSGSAN